MWSVAGHGRSSGIKFCQGNLEQSYARSSAKATQLRSTHFRVADWSGAWHRKMPTETHRVRRSRPSAASPAVWVFISRIHSTDENRLEILRGIPTQSAPSCMVKCEDTDDEATFVSFPYGRNPHYPLRVFTYTPCKVFGLCKRYDVAFY